MVDGKGDARIDVWACVCVGGGGGRQKTEFDVAGRRVGKPTAPGRAWLAEPTKGRCEEYGTCRIRKHDDGWHGMGGGWDRGEGG
jgi:hypothetical protein